MKRILTVFLLCLFLPTGLHAVDKVEIKNKPVINKSYGQILADQKKINLPVTTKVEIHKLAKKVINAPKGVRVLFSGPSGTGKTLAASLLGSIVSRDVFRVDLSAIVSKYIGETEKNLNALFEQAERQNWILFFDEADALFGKRTRVKDSHDRYANVEVNYLVTRLDKHKGIVILTSNLRSNLAPDIAQRCNYEIKIKKPRKLQ